MKSAIQNAQRSVPVTGYEARAILALLQCADTLQGDLKAAIKRDKDWYNRFMPLTEVVNGENKILNIHIYIMSCHIIDISVSILFFY